MAIVEEAAKGRRVRRVTLEVGELSGVMSEAIAFCFDVVTAGTALEGAKLEICEIEGRARCELLWRRVRDRQRCSRCVLAVRYRLTRLSGEELNVKSMELMEAA